MGKRMKQKAMLAYVEENPTACEECGEPVGKGGAIILGRGRQPQWARCQACIQAWTKAHPHVMRRRYDRR